MFKFKYILKLPRIAIDAHHLEGQRTGVGRYLENILREWQGIREAEFILYFKDRVPVLPWLQGSHITCRVAPKIAGRSSTLLFQHVGLSRCLAKEKPAVFWGPGYLLPLFSHTPSLLTIHDIIYEAHPEWYSWPSRWDRLFLRRFGKMSAHRAARIVVPSSFTKNEIIKYYGAAPDKILVTPLAAGHGFRPAAERRESVFKSHGIGRAYVLFVGALVNRRCIPTLIQAFRQVGGAFPGLQLVLVGPDFTSPPEHIPEQFKNLNSNLGKKKYIHIPFAQDDELQQIYSFAIVTVALSRYEGFGLPGLEAMACGSPVITSRTAALPEVVGDAALGVADPSDVKALAKALTAVLTNDGLRIELRRKGLAQAGRFSWSRTAAATLQAILSLCDHT